MKNVASAAPVIISFQPFTSMEDFYNRVKLGSKEEVVVKPDIEEECVGANEETARAPEQAEEMEKIVLGDVAKKSRKASVRRPNKKVVESLISAGAFDCFGTRNEMMAEYYRLRKDKKEQPPEHDDDKWVELEKEMIGLCLSRPPLYEQYAQQIKDNKWVMISEVVNEKKKRIKVFGMMESILMTRLLLKRKSKYL